MEIVPKGTAFAIESTSGERCFVTYKGKPAYIRRGFLLTQQEFLEAQATLGQEHKTNNVSELATTTQGQSVPAGLIGYAWPKNDLFIPDTAPPNFKPVVPQSFLPLLLTTDKGYIVLCEATNGGKRIGLLPLKDRLGNPTRRIPMTGEDFGSNIVVRTELVEFQTGGFPLLYNQKYPVLSREGQHLQLVFAFQDFTQTVSVAATDVNFLSEADYNKAVQTVIQTLTARVDKAIHEGGITAVRDVFRDYQGDFAQETVDARKKFAKEYEMKFDAEQKAKGLVEFRGEWVSPAEKENRLAVEEGERHQRAEDEQEKQNAFLADQQAKGIYQERTQVNIGYTEYLVKGSVWLSTLSDNPYLVTKPDAMFLGVLLIVYNASDKPRSIPPFILVDEDGAEYETSSKAFAMPGTIGSLDSLNPGVQKEGAIVFDVPMTHRYKLKVSGGYWSTANAFIELSPKTAK